MLDFLTIMVEERGNARTGYKKYAVPDFLNIQKPGSDLMIRGGDFFAVYDHDTNLWSTSEQDVIRMIDHEVSKFCEKNEDVIPQYMIYSSTKVIERWHKYVQSHLRDNYTQLDNKLVFLNQQPKKADYVTKQVQYPLEEGSIAAYDELMSTLFEPAERDKLEWAMGAVLSGESKDIQKFIVLYGAPGSGKSTFLNILKSLFDGYDCTFDAKELTSGKNSFSLEPFRSNPLIAIQHDGDLSKIEDNTILNSIVSHEELIVNEKHKNTYPQKFSAFLFMGTNKPVKITDGKSGILRRLIDVNPTGTKIPKRRYNELMHQISFEKGAIAYYCLRKYQAMGAEYYDDYVPVDMIAATNDFYDYVEYFYDEFAEQEKISLRDAWELYKTYCVMANVRRPMAYIDVRHELKNYFEEYFPEDRIDGKHCRCVYSKFKKDKFKKPSLTKYGDETDSWLKFGDHASIFDTVANSYPAQYADDTGKPKNRWDKVTTVLSELNTDKLHYVKMLDQKHIVIDFDIKGPDGEKSFQRNYEAASKWPKTYAELSKSGSGIHLHYIYMGDVSALSTVYDQDIEIKVFPGNASLRRKLTQCNTLPIAQLSCGLPTKECKVFDTTVAKNEKAIRKMIAKNLNKEYHGHTKPSIDFIYKILEDAYNSGVSYDVSDLRQAIVTFASQSTNQSQVCLSIVSKMKFTSEEEPSYVEQRDETPIVFFDVEIFPNLFVLNYKFHGKQYDVKRLINPNPADVASLTKYRLVGFNNRNYDNHILYARMMGYSISQLYQLSSRLTNPSKQVQQSARFANAYHLSYTDIYDFLSDKKSLKKLEIQLGIPHVELGLDWNKEVPEELFEKVAEYCDNDVLATEAVFDSGFGQADFLARQIIAKISGLSCNHSTNRHSEKIIFGDNKNPQVEFNYPNLADEFPGYKFEFEITTEDVNGHTIKNNKKVSTYRGYTLNEGGRVWAMPGIYRNVWVFDVVSQHPSSIIAMNLFGDKYTQRFAELVEVRKAIKRRDLDKARSLFGGVLKPFLENVTDELLSLLALALKIVINSVYGLTSASFDNAFRDPRNIDNVVAKRGALFMTELQYELSKRGIDAIHIKTDSIKIENPSEEIKEFIYAFGRKYGYEFEVENVFKTFCIVNDAVYIAELDGDAMGDPELNGKWSATGAQFAHPYVYKTMFSKEALDFKDLCETKEVKTAMYIKHVDEVLEFIGKVGLFTPLLYGDNAGTLLVERTGKDGAIKYDAVNGTKGHLWAQADTVTDQQKIDGIDMSYFIKLVDAARDSINKVGDINVLNI